VTVTVDRLRLRVPGADADAGARLARLVAERLAAPLALGPGDGAIEHLELELPARPAEPPDALAGRIAALVAERVRRQLVEVGR
jgi:hypothetical protein